jgi:hypothetical protein
MRLFKIKEISVPWAILITGLMISLSVFLTTWVFFGGPNNRTKLFLENPPKNSQNTLTPQQIQLMQKNQQNRFQNQPAVKPVVDNPEASAGTSTQ